jgi:octaprenyl-diphosphate synthase
MCAGELHQVSRRGEFWLAEEEYLVMLAGKTAELIACACGLGARFAGASPAFEEALISYGRNLGIAFQLADDLLDLFGDEATTGKSIGSDFRKQKTTLPLIRFQHTADRTEVAQLQRLFESPDTNQNSAVVKLLQGSDALVYTQQKAMEYVEAAARDLAALPGSPARDSLVQITRFAIDRDS